MPIRAFVVVLPILIFLLAGCGAPPTAEADAARQSMTRASSAGADTYAAASLKEAQAAQAALDAELKAQEGKFFKSYDRARCHERTRARGGRRGRKSEGRRGATREARQGDSHRRSDSSADQDQG